MTRLDGCLLRLERPNLVLEMQQTFRIFVLMPAFTTKFYIAQADFVAGLVTALLYL